MIFGKFECHTIIKDHAIVAEHNSVPSHANFQITEIIGIKQINERRGIAPAYVKLAEG